MIEETYLKQVDDNTCIVSFEGDLDSVNKLRNYVERMYDEPVMCEDEDASEDMYDPVNHPIHYTSSGMECIDEMLLLFGVKKTLAFCLLNSWKYRKRAMYKNGEEDMKKSDWYAKKYAEIKAKGEYNVIKELKKKYDIE